MEPMDPGERIRAVREADGQGLAELLEPYRRLLRLLARTSLDGALGAKADASDVVQETLMKAHQRFGQFHGGSEPELVAWLKRILANNIADLHRRFYANDGRAIAREQSLDALLDRSSDALARLLPRDRATPSQGAAERERVVLLADAIERLEADHREVLVLRSIQELEWSEVGRRTGRTADAARGMWGRALRELGRLMESDQ
jgi:RNA polymerase sigma-70 factor (ECF subfamily)